MKERFEELVELSRMALKCDPWVRDAGHFDIEDVLANVVAKVKRRQPFLLEDRPVSVEEAHRYWHEAKAREKELRNPET